MFEVFERYLMEKAGLNEQELPWSGHSAFFDFVYFTEYRDLDFRIDMIIYPTKGVAKTDSNTDPRYPNTVFLP
jgi:hypothetical protein